jgi:hypothetical protein
MNEQTASGNDCRENNPHSVLAWHERAAELARWSWQHFVNRTDLWGAYSSVERRGKEYSRTDGSTAKAPSNYTKYGELTIARLIRHFQGMRAEHVLGLHTTGPDNTCKWGGYDIDNHGAADPAVNLRTAFTLYDLLRERGFNPLLNGSNGRGGYHLRILLSTPVPCRDLFHFLAVIRQQAGFAGEQFSKQAAVAAPGHRGQFGNWLRVPGRHHTRDCWSEVFDGERWLEGEGAVAFLLHCQGDAPSLLPAAPLPTPLRKRVPPRRTVCFLPRRASHTLADRIELYRRKLSNLAEGQGRDDVAFHFAAFLVRDMNLSDDVAMEWLSLWDADNRPPKGADRLQEILANAHAYGTHAYGSGRR